MENYTNEIIELTKQLLEGKDTKKELKEKIEYMINTNEKFAKLKELIKNNELDLEYYDFIMKLVSSDKNLFNQINKLKISQGIRQHQDALERIKTKLDETNSVLKTQVNNLNTSTKPKTNLPIIKQIQAQKLKIKNKEILKTKLDLILETLIKNRQTLLVIDSKDNKIEEEYSKKYDIKSSYDILYKLCEGDNIPEINKQYQILDKKYDTVIKEINKDIEKFSKEYKKAKAGTEVFDSRIRDYVYKKGQDNLVTYAINNLSQKEMLDYEKENDNISISVTNKNSGPVVYALIALYYIYDKKENLKTDITFISKKIPEKTTISKNAIVTNKEITKTGITKINSHKK